MRNADHFGSTRGESCSKKLPCVSATQGNAAVAKVQSALDNTKVRAALAANTTFGAIAPGGLSFHVAVGDQSLLIGAKCSAGARCTDAPDAVLALREVLDGIAEQEACSPES